MTTSASTPRLRLLLAWYVLVLLVVAVSERDRLGAAGAFVEIMGLVLMILAALGRIWSSAHIAGYKDTHLVTSGPYSACRNPLYAFSIVGSLGVGLATRSIVITALTVGIVLTLHVRAILAEERFLHGAHGEAFAHYCARVPRLVPSWGTYESATTLTIVPAVFRKAFVDAASFLLIYVLIALLDMLRDLGLLPTLLRL
jgi:protein-S-isoprenylcysteine O-methyltransferase Ste14